MSIRIINEDLDPNKQPNYYDGMQLNVDDLEELQIYLNNKIETSTKNIGFDGVVTGLQVLPDSVMAEPFLFPTVPQSSANPNLQNYRDFPEDVLDIHDVRMYQVFLAQANNIERFDLKLQLIQGTGASTLFIELIELTVPSNPLSELSLNTLYMKQFSSDQIPSLSSDGRLVVDVSAENNNQGITLVPGNYYAIQIRFIRETNSQDQLRVYHSNVTQTAAVDAKLGAHFFIDGRFQQGLFNENAQLTQLVLYHKVYTSAVQVTPGEAYFKGEHINITTTQHFLSLVDRRNTSNTSEFFNFVAVRFVLKSTDPESHPRTGNTVDSNYLDSYEFKVFNSNEWQQEASKLYVDKTWLLLAVATDRNVIPFSEFFTLQINQLTNLAYNDWLNPCIDTPSLGALQIKTARPDDFVFFIDNIPSEMPLLDDNAQQVFDEFGRPIVDHVTQVFLILYLDSGINTRKFEMALYSSTTTTPPFNSYFATITDPEGGLIPGLANFVFDKSELTPNTFYNYMIITERGRSIFIQDYNTQIRTPDPTTGIPSLTRERQFEVVLNAGTLTAVINEDLHLSDPVVPFGAVGRKVTGVESVQYASEVPGRNGTTASKDITPVEDTLLVQSDLKFEPLPMCFHTTGDLILDTSQSVTNAVASQDIIIKVNGIPATWSGNQGPERGGTGAPHVVSGQIKFSDNLAERLQQMQDLAVSLGLTPPVDGNDYAHFVGLKVTARDNHGRDCSQQNIVSVTHLDPHDITNHTLVYRVIAMGRGAGFNSGFNTGDIGNVYIENRLARDSVGVPLQFTYTPFGASTSPLMDIREIDTVLPGQTLGLGTGEQWFGERRIVFATSSGTLTADEIGIEPSIGQVFLNAHDENLLFIALADVEPPAVLTINYYQLNEVFEVINYYYTRFHPWGDANNCPILNQDVSVQNAIFHEWIVIEINSSSVYTVNSITTDLADPNNYVAMHPGLPSLEQDLLPPNKISLNPELGRIVFGADIKPNPGDVVAITYYHLRPIAVCTPCNILGVTYEARYDFNLDGRVDQLDLNIFQAAYGSSTGDTNYSIIYDFNNDGTVGPSDLQDFTNHFGTVASGSPSFREATLSRINSILVFEKSDTLRRFHVVRAFSELPTTEFPLGRTVLFFDTTTPILESGAYVVMFGFAVALVTGINSFTVTTTQPVSAATNREVIDIFNINDMSDTRQVIDVTSIQRTLPSSAIVYDNIITFTPSITASGTYVVRAAWHESAVAVVNRANLIKTVFYEERHRKNFGPFKMDYTSEDFASDGTSLVIRFAASEATFADERPDPSGLHLKGVPIEDVRFAILLFVPVGNNKVNVWRWHHFVPKATDRGIALQFGEFLSVDSRYRGKNGVPVLQPFGVGKFQVDLRPKYAGGDIENDLSNIVVIRDDQNPNVSLIHNHTNDTQGGVITSQNISFADPQARFTTGNVTDVVYQLQDVLQQQLNVLTAQLTDLQVDASQVIVTNVPCLTTPITLNDALRQIIEKIAWDELDSCP